MRFRRLSVIALLALPHPGARGDDIIYDYSGDVLPSDPASGWIVANPCEDTCTELIENGRFVLFWPEGGERAAYGRFIAVAPEAPPPRSGLNGASNLTTRLADSLVGVTRD